VLLVEDNEDLVYNLKITLEFNEYEVLTAKNGLEAIEILQRQKDLPHLIVSDIMMPQMDGYDFFKTVSENPLWNLIPFIFLTALTSSKEIRFGKMLGVDDYILKPFKEDDLLASIAGKIARSQKVNSINRKLKELLSSFEIDTSSSVEIEAKSSVVLVHMSWNDKQGPLLKEYYPQKIDFSVPIETIGFQLFTGATSIYGQTKIYDAQGFLLNIENIQSQGYIFFDSIPDPKSRGKQRPFMLGVISSKINYFQSLKIKELMREISTKIKSKAAWDLKIYWEKIAKLLLTPIIRI